MKSLITISAIALILITCIDKSPTVNELEIVNLFTSEINSDQSCYRIPSLAKAKNGNLIAAIDQRNTSCRDLRANKDINIVIRRSQDNGENWSEEMTVVDYPYGESASDPSMIVDEWTGEIFLFFTYMNLNTRSGQYDLQYVSSTDNGMSWSNPVDITDQITKEGWEDDFKFITSGRGIQTKDGSILHTLVNLDHGLHVFGSRDHGKNWFIVDTPILPGDESKIIEKYNGEWMINSRVNKSGLRYVHTSRDRGETWQSYPDSNLIDPSCNASLIRYTSIEDGYTKNRMLFSNLDSDSPRKNLTLRISYDEGKTWKYKKSIYPGASAYSSLCILENGNIGIFFEKDNYKNNAFVSLTLEWLTDGKDHLKNK